MIPVVLFLVAAIVFLILKIVVAVRTMKQPQCDSPGNSRLPKCYYLEGAINARSAIERTEGYALANKDALSKLGPTMDRLVASSDKQVELLTTIAARGRGGI